MTRMAGSIKGVTDFLGVKPNYAAQANEAIVSDAREFGARAEANALVSNAGLKAQAHIMSAQAYADAKVAQGAAAGQSSMVSGITSGLGGLAGGISKLGRPAARAGAGGSISFGGSNVLGELIGDYSGGLGGTLG